VTACGLQDTFDSRLGCSAVLPLSRPHRLQFDRTSFFLCLQEYMQPEREADNSVTTSIRCLSTRTSVIYTLELPSKCSLSS